MFNKHEDRQVEGPPLGRLEEGLPVDHQVNNQWLMRRKDADHLVEEGPACHHHQEEVNQTCQHHLEEVDPVCQHHQEEVDPVCQHQQVEEVPQLVVVEQEVE